MHRTTKIKRLIALTCLAGLGLVSACHPQKISSQRFLQFGTIIDISVISADDDATIQIFNEIEILLEKRHRQWHGWQDGELKRFNDSLRSKETNAIPVPSILQGLIADSKKYYSLTDGRFNPALGKLVAAWGFHDSTRKNPELIQAIRKNIPGMDDLIIENDQAYSLNPYLQLDFGAIAKGLAVRQIAQLLNRQQFQHFIINAGGDIFAQGKKPDRDWRVAIEDPFNSGVMGSLDIDITSSIFTSGNYQRFYIDEDETKRHHIIDPITGAPSAHISSATVVHPDPVIADVAATTLMLTTPSQLHFMAEKIGIRDYLVITEQGDVFISADLSEKITWLTQKNLNIHVH